MTLEDRFAGSMLGAALGDAVGAHFEGGPAARLVWKLLAGRALRWTDDTQMALGTAESLLACGGLDPDHLAATWARDATWSRGYGPGARKLLSRIRAGEDWREANRSVFPDGSFGNGAAMRAGPLGLYFHRDEIRLADAAETASRITHAHPLGSEGGVLIARATALAAADAAPDAFLGRLEEGCVASEYRDRVAAVRGLLDAGADEVRRRLGNTVLAHESAVTAVHAFFRHRDRPFAELLEFVIELGGDTDTIGAMAGGLWGAHRGVAALPAAELDRLEERERIERAARALCRASPA